MTTGGQIPIEKHYIALQCIFQTDGNELFLVSALSLVSLCVAVGAVILSSLTFSRNNMQSAHLIPGGPDNVHALAALTGHEDTGN